MITVGDCIEVLKKFPEDHFDSLVTDPPYGLSKEPDIADVMRHWIAGDRYEHGAAGFMGKSWDSFVPGPEYWREVYRVLKPGAHGLVFAGTRTFDLMSIALRFAGFEVRDCLQWLYGQGFPKSLDISKAIDKANGDERPIIGEKTVSSGTGKDFGKAAGNGSGRGTVIPITSAASAAWQGWGTALKPAWEPIILIRKPLGENTVAANVLKHGTGGINIDGSRIGNSRPPTCAEDFSAWRRAEGRTDSQKCSPDTRTDIGRFPANLVLAHSPDCVENQCALDCPVHMLDEQSGTLKSGRLEPSHTDIGKTVSVYGEYKGRAIPPQGFGGDSGGASRFFYCAKVSPSERNAGLEDEPDKTLARSNAAVAGSDLDQAETLNGLNATYRVKNNHPTVKPIKLMRYLVRLITPPGGLVLDPFSGSGSTGVAAVAEAFQFVGVERDPGYAEIAEKRIRSSHVFI